MKLLLGFGVGYLARGDTKSFQAMPMYGGKIHKIIIPSNIARHFDIIDINVDGLSFFMSNAAIPAAMFDEINTVAIDYSVEAGQRIEMKVCLKYAPLKPWLFRVVRKAYARILRVFGKSLTFDIEYETECMFGAGALFEVSPSGYHQQMWLDDMAK